VSGDGCGSGGPGRVSKGKAWVFGDNVDTDQIYPGAYLPLTDPKEMAQHAMEGYEGREDFSKLVGEGDFVVAGVNFGSGSSREHAPVALREAGVTAVIAKSFARIYYRNSVNIGMPILECADADGIPDGSVIEVDLATGEIKLEDGTCIKASPVTGLEFDIMAAGGLIPYLKKTQGIE
jgi:3-isopropylmalate/(R)-2-methylmalate dehydratase small subunit